MPVLIRNGLRGDLPDPGLKRRHATGALTFFTGKAWAGGHTNIVERNPLYPNFVIAGTDVSGLFSSYDGGKNWSPANSYPLNIDERAVGSIAWNPDQVTYPGHAYALVGEGAANGGNFLYSTNYGRSWTRSVTTPAANSAPVGQGNNAGDGLPNPHPRPIGSLIQVDPVNGYIYVASYKWGIYRTRISGLLAGTTVWVRIGGLTSTNGFGAQSNFYGRSLSFGSSTDGSSNSVPDYDVLYYAEHTGTSGGTGATWRTTNPRAGDDVTFSNTTVAWVAFTDASANNIEELLAVGADLFGVRSDTTLPGVNGVYKLAAAKTAAVGTVWSHVDTSTGPGSTNTQLYSIDGYKKAGVTYLLVTTVGPADAKPVWYGTSSDNFTTAGTWKNPDGTVIRQNDLGGPNVPTLPFSGWAWTPTAGGVNKYMLGISTFGGRPWLDRKNEKDGLIGGRPFHFPDLSLAVGSQLAYPQFQGMLNYAGRDVKADPFNPQIVYEAVLDSGFLRYNNRGGSPIQDNPAGRVSGANDGIALAVDPYGADTIVYVAFGDANANNKSEIWALTDPFNLNGHYAWALVKNNTTDLGASSDFLITGMIVVRNSGNGQRFLVALARGGGGWRKRIDIGGQAWVASTSTVPTLGGAAEDLGKGTTGAGIYRSQFANNLNTADVAVASLEGGFWHSTDYGATWKRKHRFNANKEGQGYIVFHPTDVSKAYISRTGRISRLDSFTTVTEDGATEVQLNTSLTNPSAMGLGPDSSLYTWGRLQGPPRLLKTNTLTPGTSDLVFTDVATGIALDTAFSPNALSVAIDGSFYTALRGNALLVAVPV